ncbi:hypothetical protein VHUM_02697 [Vanrija humicola]|uniref:glycerophosphodiester phosphodiesterase n=1 Tax=Vanrija humicola TaxID=5417 RepID=A0A7D8Z3R4_VANHU|nr:hypothetical protein VHUM_02697 [Vanrija humicola]
MKATLALFTLLAVSTASATPIHSEIISKPTGFDINAVTKQKVVSYGPRPYYLVEDLKAGPLKDKLAACGEKKARPSKWVIGHRGGGTLQFPEHSLQSNIAGARMGAGVLECDVAFTKDLQLVCRHSHCDLHTTTNILTIPELAAKCTTPFQPANGTTPAKANCCTSDITLAEYKTLCAKMDSFNASATTPQAYQGGVVPWRTTLYNQCATLLTLAEHIQLTEKLGLEHSPELKTPSVKMPFNGWTQEDYAQAFVDEFRKAGVKFKKVWPQSFLYSDILYWIKKEPEFAKQALFLDSVADTAPLEVATANLTKYKADGVRLVSPPISYLLVEGNGTVVPSIYAKKANELGLGIITWSLERSPPPEIAHGSTDYYYLPFVNWISRDSDILTVLDVLANQVKVKKIFADWTATAAYFGDCLGLKG